jgi:hypothetical protein
VAVHANIENWKKKIVAVAAADAVAAAAAAAAFHSALNFFLRQLQLRPSKQYTKAF